MPLDLSPVAYFAPVWVFLAVFGITFGLLFKTKVLGGSRWGLLFISFVIATIFISATTVTTYATTVIPWLVVLVIALFFILLLVGFIGGDAFFEGGFKIAAVILVIVVFVVAGVKVFYSAIGPYIPGPTYGAGASAEGLAFSDWFFSGPIMGALFLLILSGLVSWLLVKAK